jgi:uncharacterized protein
MTATLTEQDIQAYLEANPEALARLQLQHPEGEHSVSLVARQLIALRERNNLMETQIQEMLTNGHSHQNLDQKIHRLSLALLHAETLGETVDVVQESLVNDFNVPQVALRWWQGNSSANHVLFNAVSSDFEQAALAFDKPSIRAQAIAESSDWLAAAVPAKSFAYVPLRKQGVAGVLVLASPDPERFTPDMATDVLTRLSELISAAIARYVTLLDQGVRVD